jgi:hypothetical protein
MPDAKIALTDSSWCARRKSAIIPEISLRSTSLDANIDAFLAPILQARVSRMHPPCVQRYTRVFVVPQSITRTLMPADQPRLMLGQSPAFPRQTPE